MTLRIPLSQPSITALEVACITDAAESGWVSSRGKYIDRFEESFAAYCGTRYALTTSSGTTALHLALASYNIGAGDEVIVPDITFVSSANAVAYTGAKPVFVDIDSETLCIDVAEVERAITTKTRAIVAVHLYGHPANIPALKAIAQKRNIVVIEDAAEAHGASINGVKTGALGDCAIFSFYGNKIVTCGEGGMLTTDDTALYERALYLRNQAMSPTQRYWHTEVGYNYRMTNLQAALGFAQMKRIEDFVEKKKIIFDWYQIYLGSHPCVRLNRTAPWAKNVFWQVCLEVEGWTYAKRDDFMRSLSERGIESRPYFYPMSDMPMYKVQDNDVQNRTIQNCKAQNPLKRTILPPLTPVAHRVSQQGINLPSYFDMTKQDVKYVCSAISHCMELMMAANTTAE